MTVAIDEIFMVVPQLLSAVFGVVDSVQVRLTCKRWNEAILVEIRRSIKNELGIGAVNFGQNSVCDIITFNDRITFGCKATDD